MTAKQIQWFVRTLLAELLLILHLISDTTGFRLP
jgi:hypothetical protein